MSTDENEHVNEEPPLHEPCACLQDPLVQRRTINELGMDAGFAEVSLLVCERCGQNWLRVLIEEEWFTGSGRWYLGAISAEQAETVTAETAWDMLERLDGYFYGGSYYNGKTGRTCGVIR